LLIIDDLILWQRKMYRGREVSKGLSDGVMLMLSRRGYTGTFSVGPVLDALKIHSERTRCSFVATKQGGEPILVYYADPHGSSLGHADMSEVSAMMVGNGMLGVAASIVLSPLPMSPQVRAEIESLKIEVFLDETMLYDPTVSVFSSRVISTSNVDLSRLRPSQCPRLDCGDIIARYYGIREGDPVVFERKSLIPGTLIPGEIFIRYAHARDAKKR
jgi:hypothetical protein